MSTTQKWGDPVAFPSNWQDHAAKYRPSEIVAVNNWGEAVACIERGYRVRSTIDDRDDLRSAFQPNATEAAHDATCRAMTARRSYDPIGDGNDSEAAQ